MQGLQILFIVQMLQKVLSLGLCGAIWNENEHLMETWVYLKVSGLSTRYLCCSQPIWLYEWEISLGGNKCKYF